MINDVINSVRINLYEKTTSPLFGAMVVSWLIWNYEVVVVLFSAMDAIDKLSYIKCLYGNIWDWVCRIGAPALTAILFLFLYPFPAKFVYQFWRKKQRELHLIRQQIENETPLTVEQSRYLRGKLVTIQADYDEQLRKASDRESILQQRLIEEQKNTEKLKREAEDARAMFSDVVRAHISDSEIDAALRRRSYRLHYYPRSGGRQSKVMMFGPKGEILEGMNDYEQSWQIKNGQLELLTKNGQVHSRFNFYPVSNVFIHTNDPDTKSTKGQYMVPEGNDAL
jgi:hypothetical protein